MPINQLTAEGFGMLSGISGASFTGLLDLYPSAAAAYSVRRLSSTYAGSAMEVRIDTVGQPLYDIGFDANGDLDTADLISKAAGNDAFVRTWYDQSGNGNDAQNITPSLQPKIVSSGSILTLGTEAKPCVNFNNDYLDTPLQNDFQGFLDVYKSWNLTSYSGGGAITLGSTTSGGFFYQYTTSANFLQGGAISSILVNDSVHRLTNWYHDGSSIGYINHNGTDYSASIGGYNNNSTNRVWRIGGYPAGSTWNFIGNMQEFIVYSGNQSANKSDIKSNINTYFSIY